MVKNCKRSQRLCKIFFCAYSDSAKSFNRCRWQHLIMLPKNIILFGFKNYSFKRCRRQHLTIFTAIANSAYNFLPMSATSLKRQKWQFSSLNHQNFDFFGTVPKSPTHEGLICVKTLKPNISSLGPFKKRKKGAFRAIISFSVGLEG